MYQDNGDVLPSQKLQIGAGLGVVGGILNPVGSIVGSWIDSDTQRDLNSDNIAYNREVRAEDRKWALADYQMQLKDNISLWEMQNEYNSPDAQRRRLEEAGYNPALALGDVNNAGKAGNVEGSQVASPTQGAYEAPVQSYGYGSILGNMLGAQSMLKDIESKGIANALESEKLPHEAGIRKEMAKNSRYANDLMQAQVVLVQAQGQLQSSIQRREESIASLNEQLARESQQNTATSAAQEEYYGQAATNLESQTASNYQGIEESQSRIGKIKQEITNLQTQNEQDRKQLQYYDEMARTAIGQQVAATGLDNAKKDREKQEYNMIRETGSGSNAAGTFGTIGRFGRTVFKGRNY